jgi:hypothetical protein
MLPLLERHEIQVLLSVDMPLTKIAERVGVSVATVKCVRKESSVEHADDAAEHRRRGIGRPSKAARFTERVQTWLAEDALLPTQELLRRALADGYDGHKSASEPRRWCVRSFGTSSSSVACHSWRSSIGRGPSSPNQDEDGGSSSSTTRSRR